MNREFRIGVSKSKIKVASGLAYLDINITRETIISTKDEQHRSGSTKKITCQSLSDVITVLAMITNTLESDEDAIEFWNHKAMMDEVLMSTYMIMRNYGKWESAWNELVQKEKLETIGQFELKFMKELIAFVKNNK